MRTDVRLTRAALLAGVTVALGLGGGILGAGNALAVDCALSWDAVGAGADNAVLALTVYDGALIAGGQFANAGGVATNHVARWDGTAWTPLGAGVSGDVYALAVYNGALIAGGVFPTAGGGAANNIARWDGANWAALGDGVAGLPSHVQVRALLVYNGDLIVGGEFTTAGGAPADNVARWDGAWHALGGGANASVWALAVYQTALVAAGYFDHAGGLAANNVARWDGSNWAALGAGTNNWVRALTVYNGTLVAAGDFSAAGGNPAGRVAAWDGANWQALGTGFNDLTNVLLVYEGALYAGGYFAQADGATARHIARWNGTSWLEPGTGLNQAAVALITQDTTLVAGGYFSTAGGVDASRVARAYVGPTISVPPVSQGVELGHLGELTVTATGTAPYTCSWRKGGVALVESANITGVATDTLHFAAVAFADEGAYDVVVTDACGTRTSVAATLDVTCQAVSVRIPPAAVGLVETMPATFNVVAFGTAPLTYAWRLNGQPLADGNGISGAATDTLNIDAVQMNQAGEYDVVVTNGCGSATSTAATLEITASCVAPTITSDPAGRSVLAGQTISLRARAEGTPPLHYQWRKDGVALPDWAGVADVGELVGAVATMDAAIGFGPVQADDAGVYDVVITNGCGTVTSGTAELRVSGSSGGDPNSPFVYVPACGGGTCGAGIVGAAPLTLLALGGWKWRRRGR